MSRSYVRWYSMNEKEEIKEHDRLNLEEALEIVDRYLARAAGKRKPDDDGDDGNLFGFFRDKTDFIEIVAFKPNQISYRFEMLDTEASWFRKLFTKVFQFEEMLDSRKALVKKVEEFFTTSVEEIKRRLKKRVLW